MTYTYELTNNGYTVSADGAIIINQTFVPGVEGFKSFLDDAQKETCALEAVAALEGRTVTPVVQA